LNGSGFGATQGIGYVDLWNSNFAPVVSWADNKIVVRVPAGTIAGKAFVNQNGTWSNGLSFGGGGSSAVLRGTPVNFGNVQVGSSSTQTGSLTNASSSAVTVSNASISGSGFTMSGLSTPMTLKPAESVTFRVTFAPKARGSANGDVMVASNASDANLPVPLTGVGETGGTLSLSPPTANLGSVPVGTTKTMTATLSATGANVVISSASTTSSEFTITGATFPLTLAAGKTQAVTVRFTPQSTGAASGSISFASNAANSPAVESLTGTGTSAAASHQVNLAWSADSSTVSGYNVYRGAQSGGPYSKENSSLDANPRYADSNVTAGQTYFYVVTAVNSSGAESAHSSEVKAVIPTP
jgi:hypothetical protein